jgi:hypothetical protein
MLSFESVVSVNESIDKARPLFKPYTVASRGFSDETKAWNHLEANCPEWYNPGATVYKHTTKTASWSKAKTLFYIVEPDWSEA